MTISDYQREFLNTLKDMATQLKGIKEELNKLNENEVTVLMESEDGIIEDPSSFMGNIGD